METSEELLQRAMTAINDGDAAQLRKDLTSDVVHHTTGGEVAGQDAVIEWYQVLRQHAGWTITPHAVISAGEWAAAIHRNTFHGGSYEVTTSGRIRDGQISELWTVGMPAVTIEQLSARG